MSVVPPLKLKYRCRKPVQIVQRTNGGVARAKRNRLRVNRRSDRMTATIINGGLVYRVEIRGT